MDDLTPAPQPPVLFTGSWSRLERALAARLRDLRRTDPLRPLIVACGSSAAAAHTRRRVARELAPTSAGDGPSGLAGVSFTTIHRLATDTLRAACTGAASRLSPLEDLRLIAGIVAERGAGTYFAPILTAPGLPRALRRTFRDLREAQITAGDLAVVDDLGMRSLALLYRAYEERLQEIGRLDDPLLYARVAQAVEASPALVPAVWLCVYGLYDLPETQRAFVRALAAGRPFDAFLPGPADAEYSRPVRELFVGMGCTEAPAPATMSPAPARDATVAIVSVENAMAERAEVLRRILAAAQEGARVDGTAYRFHEMAVVHADAPWRALLVEDLERERIPVASRVRRPTLGGRALTGLLDCLVPAAAFPLERGAVVELAAVRASFLDHAAGPRTAGARQSTSGAAEVARWDRLSRDARVVGGEQQWHGRIDTLVGRTGSARIAAVADGLLEFVDLLTELRAAAAGMKTWSALSAWLDAALDRVAVPSDDEARSLLDEVKTIDAVESAVSLETFAATVRGLVNERRSTLGSLGRAGVAVVSPEELRGLTTPVVLFGGLVEGLFPPRPSPDPLLADVHRAVLSSASGRRLPTSALRSDESDLLFELTLDSATEQLVLLRARSKDGTGAPQLPSRHLVTLVRAQAKPATVSLSDVDDEGQLGDVRVVRVPATTVADAGFPGDVPGADRRAVDAAALSRLASAGDTRVAEGYLSAVLGDENAARRRLEALRSRRTGDLTAWDGVVSDPGLRQAIFEKRLSVSAVEDYLDCPFVFFARRVLRADAVGEPEDAFDVTPMDVGLLVHRVLQRVFAGVRDGAGAPAVLSGFDDIARDEFAKGEDEGMTGFPLAWESKRRQLAADLRRAVEGDPCWHGDLLPALFEWEFGGEESSPAVEVAGRTLRFRGYVDRIDVDPARTAARVIDYKTGKGDVQKKALKDGDDIQLAVYRLAVSLLLPEARTPSCRYRFVTRASGFRDDLELDGDPEAVHGALKDSLAPFVAGVERGFFVRRHDSGRCRWCDLAYACGVTARADAGKTAAVQRLTGVGPAEEVTEP